MERKAKQGKTHCKAKRSKAKQGESHKQSRGNATKKQKRTQQTQWYNKLDERYDGTEPKVCGCLP